MLLKLEDLTTEQKIGMLLCGRRSNYPEDFEYTLELVRNRSIACIQIPLDKKTPEYVAKIREAADYPILIVNDMEKGNPLSGYPFIPALTLAACNNPEYSRAFAKGIVSSAKKDGIDGIWGPIVDIHQVNGPGSTERVFGDSPENVLRVTTEINKVFHENGFMGTGKHYPGGKNLPFDSHMVGNYSYSTEDELVNFGLVPYFKLMKQGLLPAIMVGHTTLVNIDPEYPASLSKKVIDIIRKRGFDGVFFTDSFAMMAILQKYGEEKILGMAVAAGNDIILPNYRTSTKECYEMLMQNYRDGMFTEERLDEAVRRILALMEFLESKRDIVPVMTERDIECLHNVARDCITAVTDDGVSANLGDKDKRRLFVVVTDNKFVADEPVMEITNDRWYNPQGIADKIKEEFPNSEVVFVPEFATAGQNEQVLLAATRHDEVVFVTYCFTSCYLGTDCMTRRTEMLINCLIMSGKVSTVVHFGNPHAVEPLQHVERVIFGYTAPASQKYAIEVLSGKIEAKGTLPIKVDLQ